MRSHIRVLRISSKLRRDRLAWWDLIKKLWKWGFKIWFTWWMTTKPRCKRPFWFYYLLFAHSLFAQRGRNARKYANYAKGIFRNDGNLHKIETVDGAKIVKCTCRAYITRVSLGCPRKNQIRIFIFQIFELKEKISCYFKLSFTN